MPDWLIQMAGPIGAAIAVYTGIRADIRGIHEQVKHASEAANEAHKRIDALLVRGQ